MYSYAALSLSLCRGQAFDGAANMQGKRSGLVTRIRDETPSALPVHCLAHSLNLCLQDAGRQLPFIRDALDTIKEMAKLIKFSAKRSYLFSEKLVQPDNSLALASSLFVLQDGPPGLEL